ncbi:MAG: hypothetical protein IKQ96_10105 [Lachnospiraceae bacterium]|nr:hypothetical protein [Lachnospiraceae bacterium]
MVLNSFRYNFPILFYLHHGFFVSTQHSRLHPAASGVKQKLACQATGNLECVERIACGFVTAQVLSSYDFSHMILSRHYSILPAKRLPREPHEHPSFLILHTSASFFAPMSVPPRITFACLGFLPALSQPSKVISGAGIRLFEDLACAFSTFKRISGAGIGLFGLLAYAFPTF